MDLHEIMGILLPLKPDKFAKNYIVTFKLSINWTRQKIKYNY